MVEFKPNRHAIAHNKVIIIDGQVVITGSFNFTKAVVSSSILEIVSHFSILQFGFNSTPYVAKMIIEEM
jgi:PLD-like domain